jgi:hypothetical protein
MITRDQIVKVNFDEEEIIYCIKHPTKGPSKTRTGVLRSLGHVAISKALGIQSEIKEMASITELVGIETVQLFPSVSTIRLGADPYSQNLIVPKSAIFSPRNKKRYFVGVMFSCQWQGDNIEVISDVSVTSWASEEKLKRLVRKTTRPDMRSCGRSAIVPCASLKPISSLMPLVNNNVCCV